MTNYILKAISCIVWCAAITIFMYGFGVFVSFRWDVSTWAEPGRFLTAFVWTMMNVVVVVGHFQEPKK